MKWHQMQLGCTPLELLERIRAQVRSGQFARNELDHRSSAYTGEVSNKQVKILGALLLDETDAEDFDYDLAFDAVMRAVL